MTAAMKSRLSVPHAPDSRPDNPGICVRDLALWFGDDTVFEAVTFDIAGGEFVVLLGPSGVGKLQRWMIPVLVFSQAIPVFALAPLVVLWFGFETASKVIMAVLVIFFPMTTSFLDGLRRTDSCWIELATTMRASHTRSSGTYD